MNWKILSEFKTKFSKNEKLQINKLIKILLENRGIKSKKDINEFLEPKLSRITVSSVGINKIELKKALDRIKKAIVDKEEIVVFGDYDVDGICGTAILWESLNALGAKVTPYIPHRVDEGYGLSIKGIQSLESRIQNVKVIITVDNGIVANEAVGFAKKQGIDVIITDHHVPSKNLPKAYAIVHTTKLCGAGVAFLLSQEIVAEVAHKNFRVRSTGTSSSLNRNTDGVKAHSENFVGSPLKHLELVALATVADLVPLTGANRTLAKFGIEELRKTERVGLLAIIKESEIEKKLIDVYQIGHIIAPRLNAMGRLEYAMDSLRLLCTRDTTRAKLLAEKLGSTNKRRQEMTIEAFEHAKSKIKNQKSKFKNLIFVGHDSYEQGIIGLIAGRLVEEFYLPSIVLSLGKTFSKASARSVAGFNMIEFIRNSSELLVDVGGHPMAAGFTVETKNLPLLQRKMEKLAEKLFDGEKHIRSLYIDFELPFNFINRNFYDAIQNLAPFGMGNPQPTFLTKKAVIEDIRLVGAQGKHLKFRLQQSTINNQQSTGFDAIAFNMGERSQEIKIGDEIDITYLIEKDEWPARNASQSDAGENGNNRIQLKIKDLRKN